MGKLTTLNVRTCNNPDCDAYKKRMVFTEGKQTCPYCQKILVLEKDRQVDEDQIQR